MLIGFAVGMIASNAAEWVMHKHVLHVRGRRKQSFWSFHWHEHHREARRYSALLGARSVLQ